MSSHSLWGTDATGHLVSWLCFFYCPSSSSVIPQKPGGVIVTGLKPRRKWAGGQSGKGCGRGERVQFFNMNLPHNQNRAASADPAASVGMIACQFLMRKHWMSR